MRRDGVEDDGSMFSDSNSELLTCPYIVLIRAGQRSEDGGRGYALDGISVAVAEEERYGKTTTTGRSFEYNYNNNI